MLYESSANSRKRTLEVYSLMLHPNVQEGVA
jgi:hypothetical protein